MKGQNKILHALLPLLIVFPVGLLLAGTVVLAYVLDPSYISDLYRLTSMIIAIAWAFFIVPSILFGIGFVRNRLERTTSQQAFQLGLRFGILLGYGGMFALCLLVSPVTGVMWYVFEIGDVVAAVQEERAKNEDDDIFEI